MIISRIVAALFVLVVGSLVPLATLFRDPAVNATRIPADLDSQSIELATEQFDSLATNFSKDDLTEAGLYLNSEITELVTSILVSNAELDLEYSQIEELVAIQVALELSEEALQNLATLLRPKEGIEYTAIDLETSPNVLALNSEEQMIVSFGNTLGEHVVTILAALQMEGGPLVAATQATGKGPVDIAIRPKLTRLPRVAYEIIQTETYTPKFEVAGITSVNRRTQVRTRTGSTVETLNFNRGDFVKEGEVLAILSEDGRSAQRLQALATIAQAEASLVSAKAALGSADAQVAHAEISLNDSTETKADIVALGEFASQAQLRNANSAVTQATQALNVALAGRAQAEASLTQAQANLESAQANLVQIDLDIDRLTIRAPFDGRIENRLVEVSSLVNTGDVMFTIADLDPMVAKASVSDSVRQTLELGDQVAVTVGDGNTAISLSGPITLIDTTSLDATRTFEVEVEISNTISDNQPMIVDNQFATLTFSDSPRKVYRIPQSALTSASVGVNDEGTVGLLLVDSDNRVSFVEITFSDYNEGGELLIDADRLGQSPLRLVVGRGGFVKIGDLVDARERI